MARELQEILDSGELTGLKTPKVDLTPQTVDPQDVEGRMWYGEDQRTLNVKSDVLEATMNVGKELYLDVVNKSGAEILNGRAIYIDGVDLATGKPLVYEAIADILTTSRIAGIATHTIADQAAGLVTTFGKVGGVDTRTFNLAEYLYLSETTPGLYQNDAPDIASRVGYALDQDLNGSIFIDIENHTSLPLVMAYMNTAANIPTITDVFKPIVDYLDHGGVVLEYDPLLGQITVPVDGTYRVSFTLSMTFTSSTQPRVFQLQLWDLTAGTHVFTIPTTISRDVTAYDFSTGAPFSAFGGHVYEFRVACIADLTGINFQFSTYDIQSIHIR